MLKNFKNRCINSVKACRTSKVYILMLFFVAIVNTYAAIQVNDRDISNLLVVGILINFSLVFILTFIISLLFKSIESKQKVFRNISVFLFLIYLLYTFIKY